MDQTTQTSNQEADEPIIELKNLSMRFRLARERTDSLKEYAVKLAKRRLQFDDFHALKNVSFAIRRGESVALIGRNGSGKSTTLKLIAGVLSPTEGSVEVRGDIAPLIELGAGFDGDLTARENVYLNGAILGHGETYMAEHFESIMDFAELWDFVDVPIKNFSSGMTARLGFAIATEVSADILIVDEILGVGDFQFQEKCRARMDRMMSGGTTLLLVSHSEEQVRQMCGRAIWLERGEVRMDGPAEAVCGAYRRGG